MSETELGSNLEGEGGDTAAVLPERNARKAKAEKRITIILEENDEIPPTGQFFGVNGKAYILRPGEKAEVPQGLIDVLDNAVGSVPVLDPNTKQVIGYRDKLRFPYRILEGGRK